MSYSVSLLFLLIGLEELGVACHEAAELCWHLNRVEDQREALSDATLSIFHVVEPVEPLLTDRLRALPGRIQAAVSLGIHRDRAGLTLAPLRVK